MPHQFPIDRYLNVRAATSPSFSPDGRFVAYLSNTTGIPQVWLIPTTGGEPTQLTFGADAVRGVWFSPIRHELIFAMDAGGNERTQLYRLFGVGGGTDHAIGDGWDFENLTNGPNAIHTFGGWSHDGTKIAFAANREDASRFDIYVQEVASGPPKASRERQRPEAKLLAKGPGGYYSATGWSPNDKHLLIHRVESNINHDLYAIDIASGKVLHLTKDKEDLADDKKNAVVFDNPRWSADGDAIYCTSNWDHDLTQKIVVFFPHATISKWGEVEKNEVEQLEPNPKYAPHFFELINIDGRSDLQFLDREARDTTTVTLPLGVVSDLRFSRSGNELAFAFDGPRNNTDVWFWRPYDKKLGDKPIQLTHSGRAGLPFNDFVEPELIKYKSFDGLEIPAWWYPAKPQATGPVIVYPHGGPESQTRPNFTALFQYFLARGYSILAPNVRGSSGYGTKFMNLDNTTKRMDSVADLAHAAHWIREQKKGDPKRIAVYGGSYGGFMVLAALTHYPDLWAAGIDVVGICNFVTFLEQTGAYRRAHREKEYGNLREHREFLEKISPLNHVDKIKCPLMVIHGANDPRVPVGEAEQIVAALKKRNVPVEYLRYEDEGHGLVKLKNRLDAYPKMAAFLDRYLKSKS